MNFFQKNLQNKSWRQIAVIITEQFIQDPTCNAFKQPVDEIKDQAPDYYITIKEPMDLSTLKAELINGTIENKKCFIKKLLTIWRNAQQYNSASHMLNIVAKKFEYQSKKMINYVWKKDYYSYQLYEPFRESSRNKEWKQTIKSPAIAKKQNKTSLYFSKQKVKTTNVHIESEINEDIQIMKAIESDCDVEMTNMSESIVSLDNDELTTILMTSKEEKDNSVDHDENNDVLTPIVQLEEINPNLPSIMLRSMPIVEMESTIPNNAIDVVMDQDEHNTLTMVKQLNAKICGISSECIQLRNENEYMQSLNSQISNECEELKNTNHYLKKLNNKLYQMSNECIELRNENKCLKQQLVMKNKILIATQNKLFESYKRVKKTVDDLNIFKWNCQMNNISYH